MKDVSGRSRPHEPAEVRRGSQSGYTQKPAIRQEKVLERVIRGPEQLATIAIEGVRPDVDCGRYAVKRVVGDDVVVTADVFTHAHTELAVQLEYRHQTGRTWKSVPMQALVNDRWSASFPADRLGEYRFRIVAVARRARDLAARLRQEARGRRRLRPRPRRGCAPRRAVREAGDRT